MEEKTWQKKSQQVYQFKITLPLTESKVWRRIQVPENYNFWDLHCAIQDAMGWEDYHLHEFQMKDPAMGDSFRIGPKVTKGSVPFDFDDDFLEERKQKIKKWFSSDNKKALYTYDFGDNWEHEIKLEKILPKEKDKQYPCCLNGKGACPPEDCGGIFGYQDFVEVMSDPKHENYEELLEWYGSTTFDPEQFDPKDVSFFDPKKRWDMRSALMAL